MTISTLRVPLCIGGMLLLACSSSDTGGPTGPGIDAPGFHFTYVDTAGTTFVLQGDSGSWATDATSFYANMHSPEAPASIPTPLHIFLGVQWPSAPIDLSVRTYTAPDASSPVSIGIELDASQFLQAADSATITITYVDSVSLQGHMTAILTQYLPMPGGQRYTISGSFRLRKSGT